MIITNYARAAALASGVIFPLYFDPGTNCSSWTELSTVAANHTRVPFWIIINPSSGPGDANSKPDTNYQTCIPKLFKKNKNTNIKILGYVPTDFGDRDPDDVLTDVKTYKNWGSKYRPDGYFFDETRNVTSEGNSTLANYKKFASKGGGITVLNPGTPISKDFYKFSTFIVTAENSYANIGSLHLNFSSSTPANKQAVILHDGPSTTSNSTVQTFIHTDKIKALYITNKLTSDDTAYTTYSTDFKNFVALLEAAALKK